MVPDIHHPAVVKINLGAIRRNIENEMQYLEPGQKMLAVVKANGYNHGAVEIAKLADQVGAAGFCMTILDEVLELRRADITKTILVLGVTSPEYAPIAAASDVSLTAPNLEWLKEAEGYLENSDLQLKIHLGIDSGMDRIGFNEDKDFTAANEFLRSNDSFYIEGMFAHFVSTDSSGETYFKHQCEKFSHMRSLLAVKPGWIRVDNTAASIFHDGIKGDLVRFGVDICSLNPPSNPNLPDLKSKIALDLALSFENELTHVKTIHQGDEVGCGSTFVASKDTIVGTVPIGYVDGFIGKFQGFKIKVGNACYPTVGRICMDQFMVEMPKEIPTGTKVVIISNNPDDPNNIKATVNYVGMIHYEVICLLNDRLPRVYYED